jgi:predicted hotdog family 3-hydroxylacyl-ACP dehydratase
VTGDAGLPAIATLVPHGDGACLLDRMLEIGSGELAAEAIIGRDTIFSEADGSMMGWHAAELMAQAVSAYSTASRNDGGPPRIGLLLGVRGLRCQLPRFPAGSRLEVRVRESTRDEQGMAVFDCSVALEGAVVAAGTLTAYEPVDARSLFGEGGT